jgi:hypothetical protein
MTSVVGLTEILNVTVTPSEGGTVISGGGSGSGVLIPSVDTLGYNSISVQLTGAWEANITFQASNDNVNWVNVLGYAPNSTMSAIDTAVNNDIYMFPVIGRYFQVVSSGSNFDNETPLITALVQDLKLDFIIKSYSVIAPDNAVYGNAFFKWTNAVVGQQVNLDSILLEQSSVVKPYFDGASGFTSTDDLLWENNEAFVNRSHYYKNRVAAELRLIKELPNYLMNGSPFALFLAQPTD